MGLGVPLDSLYHLADGGEVLSQVSYLAGRRVLVWFLVAAASATVGVAPALVEAIHTPTARFALYIAGLAIAIVGAISVDVRRGGDLCSPLGLTAAFYFLAFVAGPIFFWLAPSFWFVTNGTAIPRAVLDHGAMATATGLCLLGWVGFAIGYELRIFRFLHLPPLKLDRSSRDPTVALWVLWAVGWGARAIQFSKGVYFHSGVSASSTFNTGGTLSQALSVGELLPLMAVAYAGVMRARTGARRWRWLYLGGLLTELAYAIPSGGRQFVAAVVVMALVVNYYKGGRLPWRALAIGGAIAFLAFPVLNLERGATTGSKVQTTGSIGQSFSAYINQPVSSAFLYGAGAVLSRFSDIVMPAALVENRHVADRAEPDSVFWLFTDPVPRALWPSKPDPSAFTGSLPYDLGVEPIRGVPVATTQVGEMYLDFGTVGVLLGLLVVGSMFAELGGWLRHRQDRGLVTAIYAALSFNILVAPETILAQGFGGLVREAIVIPAILWLAIRVSQTRDRRVAA